MTPAEKLVCAIIRGDATAAFFSDNDILNQVVEAAIHHGVHLILFDTLKKSSAWNRWPIYLREKLQTEAVTASALDLLGERELRKVLISLVEYGVRPLLLKGASLAYTVYPSPALRPRGDTDLLVREGDLPRVAQILRKIGYDGSDPQIDTFTSYECPYRRKGSLGTARSFDVHWKINNSQLFAKTFTFDELLAQAIEILSIACCARGLGYTHALLLACMHRFGHAHAPFYVDGNRIYAGDHLRWIYDIHLLCSALTSAQWLEFINLARTKSIARFCLDGLNAAKEAFNTQIPIEATGLLQRAAHREGTSVEKLRASEIAWFFANLRALPDLRQRVALITQTVFPPLAYMIDKYKTKNRLVLYFLYGYRSVSGVVKRIKRRKVS